MLKECGICGKAFETTRSSRKYCDECSPHSGRLKIRYNRELARSKREYYEPTPREYTCAHCSKTFITIPEIVLKGKGRCDDGNTHFFCSKNCKREWEKEHLVCRQCGKHLKGKEGIDPDIWQTQFCSDKCWEEYKWHSAKLNGWIRKCEACGKEFIRTKPQKYCSRDCYLKTLKDERENGESSRSRISLVKRKERCPVCGKMHEKTYPSNKIPLNATCCCEEHQSFYDKKMKAMADAARRAREIRESRINAEKEKNKKKETTTSICATCKTSYKDCYLMKSGFRTDPEGVKRNGSGAVTECPQFK